MCCAMILSGAPGSTDRQARIAPPVSVETIRRPSTWDEPDRETRWSRGEGRTPMDVTCATDTPEKEPDSPDHATNAPWAPSETATGGPGSDTGESEIGMPSAAHNARPSAVMCWP